MLHSKSRRNTTMPVLESPLPATAAIVTASSMHLLKAECERLTSERDLAIMERSAAVKEKDNALKDRNEVVIQRDVALSQYNQLMEV
jgi:hypothetical protein